MCIIHDRVCEFVFKEVAYQLNFKKKVNPDTLIPNVYVLISHAVPVLYVVPDLPKGVYHFTVREAIQFFETALRKSVLAQACLKKAGT